MVWMVLLLQSWSEAAGMSSKSSSPKDKNFGAGWGNSCIGPGDRHPDPVYHPQPVWGLCCTYHRAPPQYHYGLHKVCHDTKPLNRGSQTLFCGILKLCSVCLSGTEQYGHIYCCTTMWNPVTLISIWLGILHVDEHFLIFSCYTYFVAVCTVWEPP